MGGEFWAHSEAYEGWALLVWVSGIELVIILLAGSHPDFLNIQFGKIIFNIFKMQGKRIV